MGDSTTLDELKQLITALSTNVTALAADVDEDITSTSTPAAPSLQAPPSGPITRARARELNYVMVLKNEGYVAGFGLRTNVNL
jgi:hypothetical protein